jgi:hypothetical protein
MTRLETIFYMIYYAYISLGAGYFLRKLIKRELDFEP